jgi:hydroxypyruvate reductase
VKAALAASDAGRLQSRSIDTHPLPSEGLFTIVAAGKAAQPMARAIVGKYGLLSAGAAGQNPGRVRELLIASGSHPVPNQASVDSGFAALRLATEARERGDVFVLLLSGGASAMLAAPAPGLSLSDLTEVTRLLLQSGLPIADLNAVRKHLSAIKGGRLAVAAGTSITFAISDVHAPIEDDPSVIASGPTVGDASTFASAIEGLERGGILDRMPASVVAFLREGARGERPETVKPDDPRLQEATFVLAGSRRDAMAGAAEHAGSLGYHVESVEPPTLGAARDAAASFAARALSASQNAPRPFCLLASGETTVRVTGNGRGGRNQEFALAFASARPPLGAYALASIGTDGIDGPTDAAGALVDATTLARARETGLDAAAALNGHDAYPFFRKLKDLLITGATETNVGDLQILLVE